MTVWVVSPLSPALIPDMPLDYLSRCMAPCPSCTAVGCLLHVPAVVLQCFVNGVVDASITDMRACPDVKGEVAFPPGMPPYPFGVDPVWHGTKSELPFLNSMKMKMSILLGVVHMNLGIIMSWFNNLYFRDRLSTICEFIPQVGVWRVEVWGCGGWRCGSLSLSLSLGSRAGWGFS